MAKMKAAPAPTMPGVGRTEPCWRCYARFVRRLAESRYHFSKNERIYLATIAFDLDKLAGEHATPDEIQQTMQSLMQKGDLK